jgi:hypothetical protein
MTDKYQRFVDTDTEINLNEAEPVENEETKLDRRETNRIDYDLDGDIGESSLTREDIGPVDNRSDEDVSSSTAAYQKLDNNNEDRTHKIEISEKQFAVDDDDRMPPITGVRYVILVRRVLKLNLLYDIVWCLYAHEVKSPIEISTKEGYLSLFLFS